MFTKIRNLHKLTSLSPCRPANASCPVHGIGSVTSRSPIWVLSSVHKDCPYFIYITTLLGWLKSVEGRCHGLIPWAVPIFIWTDRGKPWKLLGELVSGPRYEPGTPRVHEWFCHSVQVVSGARRRMTWRLDPYTHDVLGTKWPDSAHVLISVSCFEIFICLWHYPATSSSSSVERGYGHKFT